MDRFVIIRSVEKLRARFYRGSKFAPDAEILLGRACPKPSRADGRPLRKFIQRSMMPIPKTYQTPHRTRIVKTRLSEEEYEDFRHRCDVYQVSQSE